MPNILAILKLLNDFAPAFGVIGAAVCAVLSGLFVINRHGSESRGETFQRLIRLIYRMFFGTVIGIPLGLYLFIRHKVFLIIVIGSVFPVFILMPVFHLTAEWALGLWFLIGSIAWFSAVSAYTAIERVENGGMADELRDATVGMIAGGCAGIFAALVISLILRLDGAGLLTAGGIIGSIAGLCLSYSRDAVGRLILSYKQAAAKKHGKT